jgi:hypothetical protein
MYNTVGEIESRFLGVRTRRERRCVVAAKDFFFLAARRNMFRVGYCVYVEDLEILSARK